MEVSSFAAGCIAGAAGQLVGHPLDTIKVYAQENPLDVYREEGLNLFAAMERSQRQNTIYSFMQYQP